MSAEHLSESSNVGRPSGSPAANDGLAGRPITRALTRPNIDARLGSEVIVVSGLPRSGTSLMMQMLARGGFDILSDGVRRADQDNPHGYYELEKVKAIERDSSWLPVARGKVLKMVSQLLYYLPDSERYRIVFMRRDLDEVLASQAAMLKRLGRPAPASDDLSGPYRKHLAHLQAWLTEQPHIQVLPVNYGELVAEPRRHAEQIRDFLAADADIERMASAVDPALYRNRLIGVSPR
jgi:hypothetical protein